jgi:hypothetical protein
MSSQQVNVRVPDVLVGRLRSRANEDGVSVAQVVIAACRQYVAAASNEADVIAILQRNEGSKPLCVGHYEDWAIVQAARASERKTIVQDAVSTPAPTTKTPIAMVTADGVCSTLWNYTDQVKGIPVIHDASPICGKMWWEDGERYECLMERGHLDRAHGVRGMVRRVEQ